MSKFKGIVPEAFWLLAQNRFNNSKEFYDANKTKIREMVIEPLRNIASLLADDMVKIDPEMNLEPSKMISRIRRDTRFTNDKTLYRENVWISFMRPKTLWSHYPGMWFEAGPGFYSYGIGILDSEPAFMAFFRARVLAESEKFLTAVASAQSCGARAELAAYKKEKIPGAPEPLKKFVNAREFYFIAKSDKIKNLETGEIIDELRRAYAAFAPLYDFLAQTAAAFNAAATEVMQ